MTPETQSVKGLGMGLKKLRQRSGLTQEQLAEKLGVRRASISDWERGTKPPTGTLDFWVKLANALGVSLDDLANNS